MKLGGLNSFKPSSVKKSTLPKGTGLVKSPSAQLEVSSKDSFQTVAQRSGEIQKSRYSEQKKASQFSLKALASASLGITGALAGAVALGPLVGLGILAGGLVVAGTQSLGAKRAEKKVAALTGENNRLWEGAQQKYGVSKAANGTLTQGLLKLSQSGKSGDSKGDFAEKYGPYALVTGGSKGLGLEFAKQLAGKGVTPILVARNQDSLKKASLEIEKEYGVKAPTVSVDMTKPEFISELAEKTKDYEVGLVVSNAGMWKDGQFLKTDMEAQTKVLQLNVIAPQRLASHYGGKMAERGKGGFLFVGSGLANGPTPLQANYAGSKAWSHQFAPAFAEETKQYGVDVSVVVPGAINTGAADKEAQGKMPLPLMEPGEVVKKALSGLGKRSTIYDHWANKLAFGVAAKLSPPGVYARMTGLAAQHITGEKF